MEKPLRSLIAPQLLKDERGEARTLNVCGLAGSNPMESSRRRDPTIRANAGYTPIA